VSNNGTLKNRHGSAVITRQGDTDYVVTRSFDAPADLVFEAHTTPELVQRWWGFETSQWQVCEIDLRVGGSWRWVVQEPDGMVVGFHGAYLEIERPHRLVYTEMYEMPHAPLPDRADYPTNTVTLDEVDGVTHMTVHVHHTTGEERDMVLASGMESGMQVSYDRLEDVVRAGAR